MSTPKSQHTPGRWVTDPKYRDNSMEYEPGYRTGHVRVVDSDELLGGWLVADTYGQTDAESQANARLIAAAPSLYAALREAVALVEGNSTRSPFVAVEDWKDALLAAVETWDGVKS